MGQGTADPGAARVRGEGNAREISAGAGAAHGPLPFVNSFLNEIHSKKARFEPLAKHVRAELIGQGEDPKTAAVETRRLFKIEGNLSAADAQRAAETLLVDPVVETAKVEDLQPAKLKKVK